MKGLIFNLTALGYSITWAVFGPSIRVDHQNLPNHACIHSAITIGPNDSLSQPIYIVFQDDSLNGVTTVRSDIYFQKSTDGGMTFLPQDILVRRGETFACYPDITTDADGNIYIVYTERQTGPSLGHIYCTRSTDRGTTWSIPSKVDDNLSPVTMGWAKIAVDTAGNLFVSWNDGRLPYLRIWSSVSTDKGITWRTNVQVSDDTVSSDCYHPDVAVQTGINSYLVTYSSPYYVRPNYITHNSVFTKSTDGGRTFLPKILLDTFSSYCGQPHVVANHDFIICNYSGAGGLQIHTQSRTSFDFGINWTPPVPVTNLDTLYSSYYNGAKLAIDHQEIIHSALMICDIVTWNYEIYYTFSNDYGLSWSEREIVNDAITANQFDPDIAVDNNGWAYVVWQDIRNNRDEIWFATNRPSALVEQDTNSLHLHFRCTPTIFRNNTSLQLTKPNLPITTIHIYNSLGVLVKKLALRPNTRSITWNGSNDSNFRCPPGIYIIKIERNGKPIASHKVVLLS